MQPIRMKVEVTRTEMAWLVTGLQNLITMRRASLRKAQKREQATGRYKPGNVASRAMDIVHMEELIVSLVRSLTDAEAEEAQGRRMKDADQCSHDAGCPTYVGGHCNCEPLTEEEAGDAA